jgi:putative OPT family oligopeptide transporter
LEITLRGTLIGAAITVVFMAANVYLGLKTGMTFSSSIPASIISMSALTALGASGILENNIVQTQASAAGTLCNVILVIPGLLLIGFWHDFPLWQTMALCFLGGLFGVAYSVPLRRVMVVESKLPFPEGIAAAEVLIAGHKKGTGEGGLRELSISAGAAALFDLVSSGFKLIPDQLIGACVFDHAIFRLGGGLSLALIGVGYLVRLGACLALLLGVLIAWGVAVPILTSLAPSVSGDPGEAAEAIWSGKVRLIGAGIIAVGGLWTVVTLIKPIISSISSSIHDGRSSAKSNKPRQDRDVPIIWAGMAIAALCVPSAGLFAWFAAGSHLTGSLFLFVIIITGLTALLSFFMASACGYLAGLLGSSSSPISGFGILTAMLIAIAFGLYFSGSTDGKDGRLVVALTLFISSMIVTTASIANDNLQDLKTGHMIGATPWKQQAALVVGVTIGAITISPVLELLYHSYGFVGVLPRPDMNPQGALLAPQATLITQIANGIVRHELAWNMVFIGAALGGALVAAEAWFRHRGFSLPALTVGIGVYLPSTVVVTIAAGGVIGWLAESALARRTERKGKPLLENDKAKVRRRGVLIASGFLVGESVTGIIIAGADAIHGKSESLAFSGIPSHFSTAIGLIAFTIILTAFFRATARLK